MSQNFTFRACERIEWDERERRLPFVFFRDREKRESGTGEFPIRTEV